MAHDRIVAAARQWMAPQQASHSHESSTEHSKALNRFHGVFRAGGNVATGRRKQGRDRPLVGPQQLQRDEFGELAHTFQVQGRCLRASSCVLSGLDGEAASCPASFCSMTTKARRTSFSSTAKSAVSADFLGLMTTSASTVTGGRDSRTASRNRRRMRLRCTAPPKARLTVKPTRTPRTPAASGWARGQ